MRFSKKAKLAKKALVTVSLTWPRLPNQFSQHSPPFNNKKCHLNNNTRANLSSKGCHMNNSLYCNNKLSIR